MKKILALLLSALLIFTFAACKGKEKTDDVSASQTTTDENSVVMTLTDFDGKETTFNLEPNNTLSDALLKAKLVTKDEIKSGKINKIGDIEKMEGAEWVFDINGVEVDNLSQKTISLGDKVNVCLFLNLDGEDLS